ncbi:RICIN domain-containing protein [Sphaerisporangium rubeum]|uniref:Poly(3-hydroxybutyrate) depolymerase n=1 Tax=Sphaerisporangium rubeum TaxID=321317 RepID=A0A7X0ILD4_9ACTN|nr:ricin-type beta-trefoil lectin domain protein [Sphaerisporangium rubeum]MBB6475857.1 poly(3-hydroxybutyrate) depolymerase [Sphaerisporangium rubeum]
MLKHRSVLGAVALAAVAVLATSQAALSSGSAATTGTAKAASAAALAGTAGCGKNPTLTSGTRNITTSGKNRQYILRIPANYNNNNPYRLIIGLHWLNGNMNDVDTGGSAGASWAYYGQRQLSNNSTIFISPQGFNNGWANNGGEDVVFMDDILRQVEADLCVDPSLRFAMGFSYGGGMSFSLACSRANVFRAVAVFSGAQLSGCSGGTQPIAYMGLHGISDNVLNISQGRALRDKFVQNNGCTPQNPREPSAGSRTHITTEYSGCRAGYPVVWAAFDGGHGPAPVDGSGGDNGAQTWTKNEVWRFVSQFQSTSGPNPTPTATPTVTPTVTPTATPTPGGTFRLRNEGAGRCVDSPNSATANGTQLQIYDCHTNPNQSFTYDSSSRLVTLGKCLDVPTGGGSGTRIQLYDCHGNSNQRWTFNSNGTVTSQANNLCLSVTGTGNTSGVTVASCNGQATQRWTRA